MLKQYNLLTRCLTLINIPILPHIEKLKLEIQLILLKQLLLMQPVEAKIRDVAQSESEFEQLAAEIEEICNTSSDDIASRLSEVTAAVKRMTEELKKFLVQDEDGRSNEKPRPDHKRLWS